MHQNRKKILYLQQQCNVIWSGLDFSVISVIFLCFSDPLKCDAGSEWSVAQGQCENCQLGHFKEATSGDPCTPCTNSWTTKRRGATSENECVGQYQPLSTCNIYIYVFSQKKHSAMHS